MKKLSQIALLMSMLFLNLNLGAQAIMPKEMHNMPNHEQSQAFKQKERSLEGAGEIYANIKESNLKFENDLDPYEQQDNYEYYRSPYPLIRTTQTLYSQKTEIQPGYYLITPRKIGAKTYIFFKQKGRISHIVPVFQIEDIDPEEYYPKQEEPFKKFPWGVRHVMKFLNIMIGRYTPPIPVPQHKVDCFPYDADYYGIDVYYEDKLYKTIYKFEKDDQYL